MHYIRHIGPSLGCQEQEYQEFKVTLGYIVLAIWNREDLVSKQVGMEELAIVLGDH